MKHTKWVIVGVVKLVLLALVGCGAPVEKSQLDALIAQEEQENQGNMGVRGNAQNGKLVTGDSSTTVSMQVNLEADTYTVQFFINPPASGCQTKALVTWTVNGNPITRLVSVAQGTALEGVGENVKVVISDATDTVNYGFAAGVTYDVSVSVAKGTRGSDMQPPTLTPSFLDMINPGVSFTSFGPGAFNLGVGPVVGELAVPQGIGIKSIWVTAIASGALPRVNIDGSKMQIQMVGAGGAVTGGPFIPNLGAWVPIGPGITQLNLFNNGAPSVAVYVQYGIDG